MSTKPPTTEIGYMTPGTTSPVSGTSSWTSWVDDSDHVTELVWPQSVTAYDRMRKSGQIHALILGSTLPLRRYQWKLDPNGAPARVYRPLAEDLGLPLLGREQPKTRSRTKGRFNFGDHLRHALLGLVFGHMFFEQVGEIQDGMWRLRKLAPRMPQTIAEIKVEPDGGLKAIKQNIGPKPRDIPVNRLVAYPWDMEGATWTGRSMLRPLYAHWLIKDRLMRVDAMNNERSGMGLPVAEAPPGASDAEIAELRRMASSVKVGGASGVALPSGARLSLEGVRGSLPDTIGSIRYHDEAMARAWLMMFIQLGQTESGSRALGGEFVDYFALAQEAIAEWFSGIFNPHVIEDWVDWNFGEDTKAPVLVFEPVEDPSLSIADLGLMAEKGVLSVDSELRAWFRKRHKLPEEAEEEHQEPPPGLVPPQPDEGSPEAEETPSQAPPEVNAAGRRVKRVFAAAAQDDFIPDRKLRRQLYEQEVQAQTNFRALDEITTSGVDRLVTRWGTVKAAQIDELAAQIAMHADPQGLASIAATPVGADVIEEELLNALDAGIVEARAEAARQGARVAAPQGETLAASIRARAEAVDVLLARSISEAAGRKALSLTGGTLSPTEVAGETATYLKELSDKYLEDQFGGSVNQAMNSGRKAVFREAGARRIYASELLDTNTCELCSQVDGTEYNGTDDSEQDYPTGGYKDCLGGPRCRGTLVAVFDEAAPDA